MHRVNPVKNYILALTAFFWSVTGGVYTSLSGVRRMLFLCRDGTLPLLLLCNCFLFVLAGCDQRGVTVKLAGETMGTVYSVQIVTNADQAEVESISARVDSLLIQVNNQMSTYQEDSELSRFNSAPPGAWFPVSAELATLIDQAGVLHDLSEGAFDVTVGPLVNLWGFGPSFAPSGVDGRAPPTQQTIKATIERIGQERVRVRHSPPALYKSSALYLDLSAIAKGYAVDVLADMLGTSGLTSYLVEIGGEIRAHGYNAQGLPWRIGIERPDIHSRGMVLKTINVVNSAVATSGDYRNFFVHDGVRYSHMIDARTGWPVRHELAAVTVLAESAAYADGLATLLYILGPEKGLSVAESQKLAALFVVRQDEGYFELSTSYFRMRKPEKATGG